MSRRAIISDIHGNLVALEAVLADIKTQNVDEIVCLGDICGYGPQPLECMELVRDVCAWSLCGNHDEALFTTPDNFGSNALKAILWQRTILEPKPDSTPAIVACWNWLKGLSPDRTEKDVTFVHASPRDALYEYVLREDFDDKGAGPTQKAKDIFASMEWLCFCGHSHRPGVVAEDFKWILPQELDRGSYIVKRGFKTIVNIGSVGQPRDGIASACYVLFDYKAIDSNKTTHVPSLPQNGSTQIFRKPLSEPPPAAVAPPNGEEDTRYGQDLQQARDTAMLNMPRISFRRVDYDIAEAQARFRAVPELPLNNALRLALGL